MSTLFRGKNGSHGELHPAGRSVSVQNQVTGRKAELVTAGSSDSESTARQGEQPETKAGTLMGIQCCCFLPFSVPLSGVISRSFYQVSFPNQVRNRVGCERNDFSFRVLLSTFVLPRFLQPFLLPFLSVSCCVVSISPRETGAAAPSQSIHIQQSRWNICLCLQSFICISCSDKGWRLLPDPCCPTG